MSKSDRIYCLIEPELAEIFKQLCLKRDTPVSAAIRAMIIDECRMHGLLPEEASVALLKRQQEYVS